MSASPFQLFDILNIQADLTIIRKDVNIVAFTTAPNTYHGIMTIVNITDLNVASNADATFAVVR